MSTHRFKTNINCGGCLARVTPFLNEVREIEHWEVDTNDPQKILTVESPNPDSEAVIQAVRKAGFSIEVLG